MGCTLSKDNKVAVRPATEFTQLPEHESGDGGSTSLTGTPHPQPSAKSRYSIRLPVVRESSTGGANGAPRSANPANSVGRNKRAMSRGNSTAVGFRALWRRMSTKPFDFTADALFEPLEP